ncbi:hypothetical protein MJD09_21070 [bacterium]|nr:hypothetical protein [bacterium]
MKHRIETAYPTITMVMKIFWNANLSFDWAGGGLVTTARDLGSISPTTGQLVMLQSLAR